MRLPARAFGSRRDGPAPSRFVNANASPLPTSALPSALTVPPPPSLITLSIVLLSWVDLRYVAICISAKPVMSPLSRWKCSRFSTTRRSRIFSITSICTDGGRDAKTVGSISSASGMNMSSSSSSSDSDSSSDVSDASHSGTSSNNTTAFAFAFASSFSFVRSTETLPFPPSFAPAPALGPDPPGSDPPAPFALNASFSADCFSALRSSFSAVRRTWPCLFSRTRRRAAVVRRFSAGVEPSKTKIGEMRWYNRRQMRRKNPMRCALWSMSPRSSRIALMNCTSQMLASTATRLPPRDSMFTRRPVGSSKLQRFLTPMATTRCGA